MSSIGRNDLCPCGSGRKYKACCLPRAGEPRTEGLRLAHRWHTISNRVFADAFAWARRHLDRRALASPLHEVFGNELPSDLAGLVLPWLVFHDAVDGHTVAERYRTAMGDRLGADERAVIASQAAAWLSAWEVLDLRPDEGLELRDALTHEQRFVHDANASRSAERWSVLLGFVVDYPGVSVLDGLHPHPLGPGEADAVLREARRRLGVRTRAARTERMRDPANAAALVASWEDAIELREERAREPLRLENSDGDQFLFTTDHFDFQPGDRPEIASRLDALPSVSEIDESDGILRCTCTRPGNKLFHSGETTIVASLELGSHTLRAETNSIARADSIRARLAEALGPLVRHRLREHRDPQAMLDRAGEGPTAAPPEENAPPTEVQAVLRQITERHWQEWLDTRIPALDDLTPRECVSRPGARRKLVALLKSFEAPESRKPDWERHDLGRIWRELGLDPRTGALAPPVTAKRRRAPVPR